MIVVTNVWVDPDGEAFVWVANVDSRLSPREQQVLRGVAAGRTNAEIGQLLFISEHTVKSHLLELRRRLGAQDRANAVHLAHRLGLLR